MNISWKIKLQIALLSAPFLLGIPLAAQDSVEPLRTVYSLNAVGIVRGEPDPLIVGSPLDPATGSPAKVSERLGKFLPNGEDTVGWISVKGPFPGHELDSENSSLQLSIRGASLSDANAEIIVQVVPFQGEPPEPSRENLDQLEGATLHNHFAPAGTTARETLDHLLKPETLAALRQSADSGAGLLFIIRQASPETPTTARIDWESLTVSFAPSSAEESPQAAVSDEFGNISFSVPDQPLRFGSGATEVPELPSPRGWVDVTDTPFTVDSSGATDTTESLQLALTHHAGTGHTLFLPNGVYLISNGVVLPSWGGVKGPRQTHLVGQSRDGVILRLAPDSPRFADPEKPAVVVDCEESITGRGLMVTLENLTIEVGEGNPGAVGLRYSSENGGYVRNVRIIDRNVGSAGYLGLLLNMPQQGRAAISGLSVEGFRYGLVTNNTGGEAFIRQLTTTGQEFAGVWSRGSTAIFLDWTSRNAGPALHQKSPNAHVLILQSQFTNEAGTAEQPALDWSAGIVDLHETTMEGYPMIFPAAQIDGGEITAANNTAAGRFVEDSQSEIAQLHLGEPQRMDAGAPVLDLPEIDTKYTGKWVQVAVPKETDTPALIADALQEALDEGSPNVQIPFGDFVISRTLTIPPHVQRIYGSWSRLAVLNAERDEPVFRVADVGDGATSRALILEKIVFPNLRKPGSPIVENPSGRTILLRDIFSQNGAIYDGSAPVGADRASVIFENVQAVLRPNSPGQLKRASRLENQVALVLGSQLPGFLLQGSSLTSLSSPFATLVRTDPSETIFHWGKGNVKQSLGSATSADLPRLQISQTSQRLREGDSQAKPILEVSLEQVAPVDSAISDESEFESAADGESADSEPATAPDAIPVRLAFQLPNATKVHFWEESLRPGETTGVVLNDLIKDDADFAPPTHWEVSLVDVQNYQTTLDNLQKLRPIVREDNDLAPGYGLLRHFEFRTLKNPGHDSSPAERDAVAEEVRIPVEEQTGVVSFAREGARLVVEPEDPVAVASDSSFAISLHFTGLPGSEGPRGLLYEHGKKDGIIVTIDQGQLRAVVNRSGSGHAELAAQIAGEESPEADPPSRGWHHLVVQFHLGLFEMYLDGQLVVEEWTDFAFTSSITSAALGVVEGGWADMQSSTTPPPPYQGLMADVRLYERPLNPVEIEFLARSSPDHTVEP